MTELFRRIHYLLNRRRIAKELEDEMDFHRSMSGRDGKPFGNELRLREESRDAWGWTWMDRTVQDVRYALRTMRRSPGFSLAAVLMLAVGIGVNVAAFGFFNIVMLRPLPVRHPDSLVRFHRVAPGEYASDVPYPVFKFYADHTRTLSAVLAMDSGFLSAEAEEKPLRAFFVSGNFLRELGAKTAAGRLFTEDPKEGEPLVTVLGNNYWKAHFGGDPSVVGRTMRLNGRAVLVIGVVGEEFSGLTYSAPALWIPLVQQPSIVSGSKLLTSYSAAEDGVDMWGRVRSGETAESVAQEMSVLAAELRKQRPNDIWKDERLSVEPGAYAQNAGGRDRGSSPSPSLQARMYPVFGLIGALTLLILTVTCGNVGSLLLARGVARQREISIRAAVGAGRARLIRQMLTESLVLAVIGATAAVLFAHLVLHELMTRTGAPSWLDVSPDSRVLLFSVGAACLAATLFGTMPALQMIRSFRGASAARHVLIGAQVSASCVLLIVAGLLVRAIDRAVSGDPGFEYKQVISVDPRLGVHGFSSLEARGYVDRLKNKLRSVPGVQAVALSTTPPLGNRVTTVGGEKDGKRFPIHLNRIDPEFFSTMKISLQRGRYLRQGEAGSIVVSESLARRLWPGEDPLAQHFSIGDQRHTVVGVAANAHANALSDPEAVEAYQLAPDDDMPNTTILVRVAASADTTAHTIAAAARATDPRVAPLVQTLRSAFARKVETTGQSAAAVGVLGGIAVLLACVGIAGAVAYVVSQRQKEIGIRMAIGAKPSDVVRAVVGQFWTPIGAGLLLGVAAAAALSQLLRAQLYGVSPLDPIAYAAATLLLGGTAAAAALLTGRRALRVNPVKALRCE